MLHRKPIAAALLCLAAAACAKRDPVADNANGAALPPPANVTAPDPAGAPPKGKTEPATAPEEPAAAIPPAFEGRWGLTPADCTSTRGDAKGLLTISQGQLIFYESRAVASPDVQSDGNSASGTFHFTGEGQSWDKFEALKLSDQKLIRTETNPSASYTYAKC